MMPDLWQTLSLPPETWDSLASLSPSTSFLQSSAWADFKGAYGWQSQRLSLGDKNNPVAYASLLTRRIAHMPLQVGYVPRGPILLHKEPEALATSLQALADVARRQRLFWIKVDPEIWDNDLEWAAEIPRKLGWHSGQQVQFRNTVFLDITGTEESILQNMKPKTRYNIGLASRRGVSVHSVGIDQLDTIYELYRRTAIRDGFIVRPQAYYHNLWQRLLAHGMANILAASYEGKIIAAAVIVAYGHKAWYFHGASSDENRNLMPTYLLQWEAIRWAKARGCTIYDFWGAPENLVENDPLWGIYRFKMGFGGQFSNGLGAWDYTPWPKFYQLYCGLLPRFISLRRRLRQRTQQTP